MYSFISETPCITVFKYNKFTTWVEYLYFHQTHIECFIFEGLNYFIYGIYLSWMYKYKQHLLAFINLRFLPLTCTTE